MAKLTGEELSKLYPQAKTYDELASEREQRKERRTPKLVPLKISLWTTLAIPTVFIVYYIIWHVMLGGISSTGGTLSSVSFSILLSLAGFAVLFYLFSLIRSIAYKATTATSLLYGLLGTTLFISALLFTVLTYFGQREIVAIGLSIGVTFLVTYAATSLVLRLDT